MEDTFGLNKSERLKREREQAIADAAPPALEPDFPYKPQPFDPLFFGVREEWPRESAG